MKNNLISVLILLSINILYITHANTWSISKSDIIKQKIIDRNKEKQQNKVNEEKQLVMLKEWDTLLVETDEWNTVIEILKISDSFWENSINLKYYYQYKNKTLFSHTEWNHNWVESCKDDSWSCQEDWYISGESTSTLRLPFLFGIVNIDVKNNTVEIKIKSKKSENITSKHIKLSNYEIFDDLSLKENIKIGKWETKWNTIDSNWYEKLNYRYSKYPTYISFDWKKIEWADYDSFRTMGKYWWFDKNNLYEFGQAINVEFDYNTVTTSKVFPFQTIPIDKNQAYFKEYNKEIKTISHQDYLISNKDANIEKVFKERIFSFNELGLSFPMNGEVDSKSLDSNHPTEIKENIDSNNFWETEENTYKTIIVYSFLWIVLFISIISFIKRRKKNKIKLHYNND